MKTTILTVFLLLFYSCAFAQTNHLTKSCKYFPGTVHPGAGWQQIEYDDTSWSEGIQGIGYGDIILAPHFTHVATSYPHIPFQEGDTLIRTIIPSVTTLYLRYPFFMDPEDTMGISGLSLEAYFDDGFIAYLNGTEFARVNMGVQGDTAYFNTLTDRSHESQIAAGDPNPVAGYFISKRFLEENLVMGENILAIEVHNDSLGGSDLLFTCKLKDCPRDTTYNPITSFWSDPDGYFSPNIRTKAYVEPDSSNLPLIIIESDEFGIPFSHIEIPAHMKVIDKANGQLNHPSDTGYTYNGRISIEVRGGSSRYFPKQSFNIETQLANGSNNNVSLLGMPAENDWKLIGPISDRSLLRNTLTYELGRKQGHWEPRSKFCELILNGEYLGLYALTEKIKPDKNRLDISKLTDTDLSDYDLTGGYLFWSFDNLPTQIYYPNSNKIQPEQEDYIDAFFRRYREVIFSDNWLNQEIDYRDYVNTESMLDYLIINELTFDHDKYRSSTFMYKDRSDKDSLIHFGPLWDYNYAYGNTLKTIATEEWRFSDDTGDQFRRLFQDTSLTNRFAEKWHQQRDNFLHTDSLYALIDSLTTHFALARKRDSMVWDAYTTVNIYFAVDTVYRYNLVIRNLKDWLDRRTKWIDAHIDSIYYPVSGLESINMKQYPQEKSLKAYPNPCRNELEIEMYCTTSGTLQFTLYNMQGQPVQQWNLITTTQGRQTLSLTLQDKIPPGLYLMKIKDEEKQVGNIRVVKSK